MDVPALDLTVAVVVMTGAAAVQSSVGFGLSVIAVPILALLDPALAPVPQLLVALPLAVAMLVRERAHLDLAGVGWVLAGRFPGAAVGLAMLVAFSDRVLAAAIAVAVLLVVIALLFVTTVPRNPITEFLAGVASGVASMIAAIGGPPLALLYRDARGATIRSSLSAVFAIGIVITVVVRASAGHIRAEEVLVAAVFLPAVAVGFTAGGRLAARVEGAIMRRAILGISSLAAIALLGRSL